MFPDMVVVTVPEESLIATFAWVRETVPRVRLILLAVSDQLLELVYVPFTVAVAVATVSVPDRAVVTVPWTSLTVTDAPLRDTLPSERVEGLAVSDQSLESL